MRKKKKNKKHISDKFQKLLDDFVNARLPRDISFSELLKKQEHEYPIPEYALNRQDKSVNPIHIFNECGYEYLFPFRPEGNGDSILTRHCLIIGDVFVFIPMKNPSQC